MIFPSLDINIPKNIEVIIFLHLGTGLFRHKNHLQWEGFIPIAERLVS